MYVEYLQYLGQNYFEEYQKKHFLKTNTSLLENIKTFFWLKSDVGNVFTANFLFFRCKHVTNDTRNINIL